MSTRTKTLHNNRKIITSTTVMTVQVALPTTVLKQPDGAGCYYIDITID